MVLRSCLNGSGHERGIFFIQLRKPIKSKTYNFHILPIDLYSKIFYTKKIGKCNQ